LVLVLSLWVLLTSMTRAPIAMRILLSRRGRTRPALGLALLALSFLALDRVVDANNTPIAASPFPHQYHHGQGTAQS